ncbi:MAG: hypothetical protein SNG10_01885 [Rikenellaceae bacterium]
MPVLPAIELRTQPCSGSLTTSPGTPGALYRPGLLFAEFTGTVSVCYSSNLKYITASSIIDWACVVAAVANSIVAAIKAFNFHNFDI